MEPVQGEPWPEGRSSHATCCLNYGDDHPMLLVSGGVNTSDKVLDDMWILDLEGRRWTEVRKSVCLVASLLVHVLPPL